MTPPARPARGTGARPAREFTEPAPPRVEWLAVPAGSYGGNLKRYILWAKHADRRRFDIRLTYLLQPRPDRDVLREAVGEDFDLNPLPGTGKLGYLRAALRVARNWRSAGPPDLVHSLNPISDLIAAAVKRALGLDIPIVSMTGGGRANFGGAVYQSLLRRAHNEVRLFLTVSEHDKQELVRHYGVPPSRVAVHRIGLDFSEFEVADRERPGRPVIFGFAGRFSAEKGFPDLLEAVRLLRRSVADRGADGGAFRLLAAGAGPLESEARKRVRQLGLDDAVEFAGWVSNISDFLNRIDILIVPSLFEGTPRVILEAYVHGVPVIASNVGGVSEILQDGQTGLLTPAGSPRELADRMEQLMYGTTLKRLAEKGRAYVFSRHSIEESTRVLLDHYRSVLEQCSSEA